MQVERQVDQMVRFIKQEAEEKANEIMVSAEEVWLITGSAERPVLSIHCQGSLLDALRDERGHISAWV